MATSKRKHQPVEPSAGPTTTTAPPWSLEAEQSVLGAILVSGKIPREVSNTIDTDDFYRPSHRIIYTHLKALSKEATPIDLVTTTASLTESNHLEEAGGATYLSLLTNDIPTTANVLYYAHIVRKTAETRRDLSYVSTLTTDLRAKKISHDEYRKFLHEHLEATELQTLSTGKITAQDCGALLQIQLPKRPHILKPWLRSKDLSMVYGWRGAGKTWASVGIANAAASGGQFLKWSAPRPYKTLFVDGEMPLELLQERLEATQLATSSEPPEGYLNIITPDIQNFAMPNLADPDGQKLLDDHLVGIELLILDNQATLFRGLPENETEAWQPIQSWLLSLRKRGIAVVLIHHAGKGGQQRGTSSREDVLDTVISLQNPKDYTPDQGARFEVHFQKSRSAYGSDINPFEAYLQQNGNGIPEWTVRSSEEVTMNAIMNLFDEGFSQREVAKELGISQSMVSRLKSKYENT